MLGGVGGGEFGVWDEDSGELIEALAELRNTQLVYLPLITNDFESPLNGNDIPQIVVSHPA